MANPSDVNAEAGIREKNTVYYEGRVRTMPGFMKSLQMLYSSDDVQRVTYVDTQELPVVSVDVHGMKCWQAEQFINNIINLFRNPLRLIVIHGYNHGTAILDMVRNKLQNNRISARYEDMYNRGITYLAIA